MCYDVNVNLGCGFQQIVPKKLWMCTWPMFSGMRLKHIILPIQNIIILNNAKYIWVSSNNYSDVEFSQNFSIAHFITFGVKRDEIGTCYTIISTLYFIVENKSHPLIMSLRVENSFRTLSQCIS